MQGIRGASEARDTVLWVTRPVRKCRTKCASSARKEMRAGEEKGFAVARGSKIAHTVSIETIEYGPAGVWHAASAACDLAMRKG